MKTLIAVSGIAGSFSEEAALAYASKHEISDIEILHRINMEGTLSAVESHEAGIGVIPVYNKIQGPVMPAIEAMGRHQFSVIGQIRLDIPFFLLAKKGTKIEDIKTIAHYPVAANQCKIFLQKNFPNIPENIREDSALAAEELSKGILDETTAVIAPKHCAELYGLEVLAENIQDDPNNFSDFIIIKSL
ncbi:MAG: prephenate dehydratase domain-containing protein [Candidatus Moraniibacteriota bacterium]